MVQNNTAPQKEKAVHWTAFSFGSGGWIRTIDLQVMLTTTAFVAPHEKRICGLDYTFTLLISEGARRLVSTPFH